MDSSVRLYDVDRVTRVASIALLSILIPTRDD